jgi:hypothetical protein
LEKKVLEEKDKIYATSPFALGFVSPNETFDCWPWNYNCKLGNSLCQKGRQWLSNSTGMQAHGLGEKWSCFEGKGSWH